MYAAGEAHENKDKSIKFLERISKSHSSIECCTNTEVLQEILYRYQKIKRFDVALSLFDALMSLPIEVKPITLNVMKHAKRLLIKDKSLATRDAVHAGMMMDAGIEKIVSFDSDFDRFEMIDRIEP